VTGNPSREIVARKRRKELSFQTTTNAPGDGRQWKVNFSDESYRSNVTANGISQFPSSDVHSLTPSYPLSFVVEVGPQNKKLQHGFEFLQGNNLLTFERSPNGQQWGRPMPPLTIF